MTAPVKVTDLAAELKNPKTIQAPSPHASSKKLARLLRFPELLRIEIERHLGQGMQVVIVTQHHLVVQISSQRKRA